VIFPAAAALAWSVLAYACIDFGFSSASSRSPARPSASMARRRRGGARGDAARLPLRLPQPQPLARPLQPRHRVLARLPRRPGRARGVRPPVASGVARISIAAVAGVGFVLVVHLATHGYDRAVMLIPTWLPARRLGRGGGFTVMGQLRPTLVSPALIGGLVLIVMLIGFTVMQHAFAGGALAQGRQRRERGRWRWRAPATSSSTGMCRPTGSSSAPRSSSSSASSAARSRAGLGLARTHPSLRPRPLSRRARRGHSSSGAAASSRTSACAPADGSYHLVPAQGSPGRRDRTARSSGSSARSRT
jgi:hypothetical protein